MKASGDGVQVVAQTTAVVEALFECMEDGSVNLGGIMTRGDRRGRRNSVHRTVRGVGRRWTGNADPEEAIGSRSAAGTAKEEVAVSGSFSLVDCCSWGIQRKAEVMSCVSASWRDMAWWEEPGKCGGRDDICAESGPWREEGVWAVELMCRRGR